MSYAKCQCGHNKSAHRIATDTCRECNDPPCWCYSPSFSPMDLHWDPIAAPAVEAR